MKKKFNTVVLVFLDMLNAEVVDKGLGNRPLMPTLNNLKKKGVSYNNFYSCGWNTILSMPSFFSGHRPADKSIFNDGLSENHESIAEFFNNNGFYTTGITASRALVDLYNFERGFDEYFEEVDFRDFVVVIDRYYISYYNKLCTKSSDSCTLYEGYYIKFLDIFFTKTIKFIEKKIANKKSTEWLDYDYFNYYDLLIDITNQYKTYTTSKESYIRFLYKNDLALFGDVVKIDQFESYSVKATFKNFIKHLILSVSLIIKKPWKYWFLRKLYKTSDHLSVNPIDLIEIATRKIKKKSKSFTYIQLPVPHDRTVFSTGSFVLRTFFTELKSIKEYISTEFSSSFIKDYIEFRKYYNHHSYLSSARHADDCLYVLKSWLDSNLDDYLLIVTADHGHMWSSKEKSRHSLKDSAFLARMLPEYYHVPLVMYSPQGTNKSINDFTSSTSFNSIAKNAVFSLDLEKFTDGEVIIGGEKYVIFEHSDRGTLDYLNKCLYISILGKHTQLICECNIPLGLIVRTKFQCNSNANHDVVFNSLIKSVESIIHKLHIRLSTESFDLLQLSLKEDKNVSIKPINPVP
ncbi:sulfatase-like hydrolase/transferase [Candidatus Thioglobus autotrophicus]|uniref:sulfatase-like hydrolase/transferase n=1 Tax=Candidatus Thioglobus autotrophicus TaxID=1705394 RepID=UPI00299CF7C3|nr:sulfatase-like hydrolase/transferase [Candidatus Thioglobus autotrophicus]WPE17750.1 sulfatase-like hydrolase/transferase [Candidatus Thioglobus autotrophicus]